MMQKHLTKTLYITGDLITFSGVILQLIEFHYAPYVFSLGSTLLIYMQILSFINNNDTEMRKKRLSRINLFTSLLLALAAYFMFTSSNLWVIAVLIYALSTLTLSFRGN